MLGSAAAVASLGADPGGTAKPTNTIMTLASADGLLMYANVNAADLRGVRMHQDVMVAIDGFTSASGIVTAIDLQPTVTNNVTTYRTTIRLAKADTGLRMGLPATALFSAALAEGAQLVPSSAVTSVNGRDATVVVLEGCTAQGPCTAVTRNVRLVARNATTSAIAGGVVPGDLVALAGQAPSSPTFRTVVTTFEPNTEAALTDTNPAAPSSSPAMARLSPPPAKNWLARAMGL
jgi:hypothetical protein